MFESRLSDLQCLSEEGKPGPSSSHKHRSNENDEIRIFELEQEVKFLQSIFKRRKAKDNILAPERQIIWENEWLLIQSHQLKYKIRDVETETEMLMKQHSSLVDARIKVHNENSEKFECLDMHELLRNTRNDAYEIRCLIQELKKVSWDLLPSKVAKYCEELDSKMENTKILYEELQISTHNNDMKFKKMQKEIIYLNESIENEFKNNELLEIKSKRIREIKGNWQKRLVKIKKKLIMGQDILRGYGLSMKDALKFDRNDQSFDEDSKSENSIAKPNVFIQKRINTLLATEERLNNEMIAASIEHEKSKQKYKTIQVSNIDLLKIKNEIEGLERMKNNMKLKFQHELILRKTYFNEIENLKGKVRVFCRCRPISVTEKSKGHTMCVSFPDIFTITVTGAIKERGSKEFQFDKVYSMESSQKEIFIDTERLIQSVFDGFNVCIFAYGQTGSGKTFTLIGDVETNPGIVPRTFDTIFSIINNGKMKFKVDLRCYMLELYNEKLLDLMTADAEYSDKLEIKRDFNGMVFVPGAKIVPADTVEHLKELFQKGNINRHVASTKMNSESSRSHLILSIMITSETINYDKKIYGKMSIIDLAGSERLAKTGSSGLNAQEAMSINTSLSALGDVISALTSGLQFVPYRNNKLTMLMQDSLGGNAKTLMFVNISPVDYNSIETISSLTYAARVKLIKNDAIKMPDEDQIEKLKDIIQRLLKGEDVIL